MGSIGSTLNSINSSLLSEIQAYSSSAGTGASDASSQSIDTGDRIDFSQVGSLFKQLQQLQSSNPAEFKQVLSDAVSKLQDAAKQQTDPQAAAFLNKLADRFQQAADTGDLTALHPQSPAGASGAHGHHHGGHHGGGTVDDTTDDTTDTDPLTAAATQNSSNTTALNTLLGALTSSANGQNPQDLFSLLNAAVTSSGQGGTSSSALLGIFQTSAQPGSNTNQIQSLLSNFVTTNA